MKKTKYISILIAVILFSVSCKKEVGLIKVDSRFDVNKNSQFTTLWQNKLSSPYHYGTFVNLVYENVIYTSENTLGNKTTISSFNKKNW